MTVKVPQIIDAQTFDQAQAKRKSNKKTSRRKNQYLMSGRLLCGCGKHIVGCQSGGSPMYGCYQKFHRYRDIEEDVCQERYAKAWLVDAIAWDFALHSKKSGAEFRAMLEKRQEEQKRGTTKIQERLAYVERQIEEKSKKIRRIASLLSDTEDQDAIAAFKSDMRLASQVKADFEQEQEELLEKIAAMQPITDDEIVDVLIIREQEIKKLQDATFEERRRYVERIDLMGTITGGVLHLSCKLPIPGKSYDLSSPELQLTYNQVENSDVAVGGNGISGLL